MPENIIEGDWQQKPAFDQQNHKNEVITVVLTADNHLGYFGWGLHASKREEFRQRLRHAFQQATDFAIGQRVDLFVQAGDLFDTVSPDEQDRSFVAERLGQLRQAGVHAFAVGGLHDTPTQTLSSIAEAPIAPQVSYARLGALHYFPPHPLKQDGSSSSSSRSGEPNADASRSLQGLTLEPVIIDVRDVLVGICGLGVVGSEEGDPLASARVEDDIERTALSLLLLYAPIEGLATSSSLSAEPGALAVGTQVSRASIAHQSCFRYILAGYHHGYHHQHFDHCDLIVAGATQQVDFDDASDSAGFVFLGLASDGVRWCRHIATDALELRRLVIDVNEFWSEDADRGGNLAHTMLERLRALCTPKSMVQLQLQGKITREQYHQLDLSSICHYGEEHCFAFTIDERLLSLLPQGFSVEEGEVASAEITRPLSARKELLAVADEWIEVAADDEKRAVRAAKEELVGAMDEVKRKREQTLAEQWRMLPGNSAVE